MVSTTNSFDEVTELIRNRIKDDLTSVQDRFGQNISIKTVTFSWPDEEKNDQTKYPFIVISNEDAEDLEFDYYNEEVINRLSIEVAALKTDEASKLISACYHSIKTYKDTLRENGVTKIRLIDKDSDSDDFAGLNVRRMSVTFEVRWRRPVW